MKSNDLQSAGEEHTFNDGRMRSTNLFFGHVQQTHGVSLTLEVVPDGVQRFVKLTLDVRQLFKHFASGPQKNLRQREQNEYSFYWITFHRKTCVGLPDSF